MPGENKPDLAEIERAAVELVDASTKMLAVSGAFSMYRRRSASQVEVQMLEEAFNRAFAGRIHCIGRHDRDYDFKEIVVGGVKFFTLVRQ